MRHPADKQRSQAQREQERALTDAQAEAANDALTSLGSEVGVEPRATGRPGHAPPICSSSTSMVP